MNEKVNDLVGRRQEKKKTVHAINANTDFYCVYCTQEIFFLADFSLLHSSSKPGDKQTAWEVYEEAEH